MSRVGMAKLRRHCLSATFTQGEKVISKHKRRVYLNMGTVTILVHLQLPRTLFELNKLEMSTLTEFVAFFVRVLLEGDP
jgi:hypothetical protein